MNVEYLDAKTVFINKISECIIFLWEYQLTHHREREREALWYKIYKLTNIDHQTV